MYGLPYTCGMLHKIDPKIRIASAIKFFGSKSKLAEALGIARSSVSDWKSSKYVPAIHAYRLEKLYPDQFCSDFDSHDS